MNENENDFYCSRHDLFYCWLCSETQETPK